MKDYWKFKAVLRSFRATGYGRFEKIEGLEWRVRGGDYVLVSPPKKPFRLPVGANPSRARSLSFLPDKIGRDVPLKKAGYVYEATDSWTANRKTRYALRLADREGAELVIPTEAETEKCFDDWLRWVGERKAGAMIVKGHYREMIRDKGFMFIGCRLNGEVVGASGFLKEQSDGAICFTKHRPGHWWLSRYLWAHSIHTLLEAGVRSINCGDTADVLKKELGLVRHFQYKVDFSEIKQACTTPTAM